MTLPSRDSATGRAAWTGVQVLIAQVILLAINDEFRTLVLHFINTAVPAITAGSALVAFVINYFRKSVPNW